MELRPALAGDQDSIIRLIDSIFRGYGEEVFLPGCDRDLTDIEGSYRARGGEFMVLVGDGRIVGTHAVLPDASNAGSVNFRRLYLEPGLHGGPCGRRLMDWALGWTVERRFARAWLWSDVRFERAHRFYEKIGFTRGAKSRMMSDGAMPYEEYFFSIDLEGRSMDNMEIGNREE